MDTPATMDSPEPTEVADDVIEVNEAIHPQDPLLRAFQMLQMNTLHVTSLVASTLGIGPTDLRALLFIATSGGATPKQTGDFLELTSGSMTNLIDRMAAAGLVERLPNPDDRRSLMLQLAPEGTETVERVVDFYRRAFTKSVEAKDVVFLTAAFHAIGEALTETAREDISTIPPR
jgi:DNA-binding MarR family transcriptional regulator